MYHPLYIMKKSTIAADGPVLVLLRHDLTPLSELSASNCVRRKQQLLLLEVLLGEEGKPRMEARTNGNAKKGTKIKGLASPPRFTYSCSRIHHVYTG